MSNIYTSVSQLIGRTPLLEICNIEKKDGLKARVLVKLEGCNPAGSAKDRVALSMIDDAEAKGILKPGSVIIEPTSGNTGIGLCSVAAARGYKCIIVMPDSMSMERRLLMTAFGGELVLTPGARRNWQRRTPAALLQASLKILPIPKPTTAPPVRKSGRILTERWIFSWRASAPAEPLPAPDGI